LVIARVPVQTARRADHLFAVSARLLARPPLALGGGERELEIVVLRQQLAILGRGGKRPRYTIADRALLAAASRLLPSERLSCFAVSPQTLRRWHRELLEGGRRQRRRSGRPPLAAETRSLIERLARENPRWGYVRIQGELLKLGISVSATTVANVLRSFGVGPAPRRIGPTWSEFLRAQAQSMLGGNLGSALGDDRLACARAERRPRSRRSERWKPAPGALRLLLPSLAWPVSSCRCAALRRRRGNAFSLPLADRRAPPATTKIACSRRPANSRLALRPAAERSGATPKPSVGPRPHRPNHRVDPRATARLLTPGGLDATDRPPPSNRQPEPSFFTPQDLRTRQARIRRAFLVWSLVSDRPSDGGKGSVFVLETARAGAQKTAMICPPSARDFPANPRDRVYEPYGRTAER
jgi:homeodomain-containing protein